MDMASNFINIPTPINIVIGKLTIEIKLVIVVRTIAKDEFPLSASEKKAVATAVGQLKASKIPAKNNGENRVPTNDSKGMNTKTKNRATKIVLMSILLKSDKSIFKQVKNINTIKK
jgi:hypothetical protein